MLSLGTALCMEDPKPSKGEGTGELSPHHDETRMFFGRLSVPLTCTSPICSSSARRLYPPSLVADEAWAIWGWKGKAGGGFSKVACGA